MQDLQGDKSCLISFLITYYNLPVEMLMQCIDSILALSLDAGERQIIVVDDGSRKSAEQYLKKYGDNIYYLRQENSGLSGARNVGMMMARGKYIQFIDADDYLLPEGYNLCINFLHLYSPDLLMFEYTSASRVPKKSYNISGPTTGAMHMAEKNIRGTAWGYVFQRSLQEGVWFKPGILHEDEEFTPRLMRKAQKMYLTNAVAYYYRQRESSIIHDKSRRSVVRRLNDAEKVLLLLRDYSSEIMLPDSVALQRRVAQLTMDYIYNVMVQTRSRKNLERRIKRLREQLLFPLPEKHYTWKYEVFRRVTKTKLGRAILLRILLLIPKSR